MNAEQKIAAIKTLLNIYFEEDPFTREPSIVFDKNVSAEETLDKIIKILKQKDPAQ